MVLRSWGDECISKAQRLELVLGWGGLLVLRMSLPADFSDLAAS